MASANSSPHDRSMAQASGEGPATNTLASHQAHPAMTNLNGFQRQQQELIKILAQHFHNQFYQLANTTNGQIQAHQFSNHSTNQTRHINNSNSNLSVPMIGAYQQHHYHQAIQNLSAQPNNRLETEPFNQQHFLPEHLIRSQQQQRLHHHGQHLSNATPLGLGAQNPLDAMPVEFQQSGASGSLFASGANVGQPGGSNGSASSSPYSSLNDLNFFNALGFNLVNNQLVLSHRQQQSLIQATVNSREAPYETTLDNRLNLCGDQSLVSTNPHCRIDMNNTTTKDTQGNKQQQQQHDQPRLATNHDRKELLKFSINTILGQTGSPASNCSSNIQVDNLIRHSNNLDNDDDLIDCSSNADSNDVIGLHQEINRELNDNDSPTNELKADLSLQNDKQPILVSECDTDHLDCGSDSNSSCRSPVLTDTASGVGHSILFNGQVSATNRIDATSHLNLSATDNTCNNNITDGNHDFVNALAKAALHRHHHQQQAAAAASTNQHHHRQQHTRQQPTPQATAGHPSLAFLTGPAAAAAAAAFPWTVAARGKPRRGMMRRAVFSDTQRVGLEKRFQLQKYISKPDRKKLAEKLGLRDSQVKIWFQNRRMKWRNSKERELLSAGGSREQTLPTRNNPNPDLSDVGETIKRLAASSTNGLPLNNGPPVSR